ncbi:Pimeloyl-CoA dehydrogenase small subunit [Rhodovastum atsumiense]|uniref:Pimeloyl-CoA dehydrogenase small subunit n=2 Tax=Rhodovastum atsumiense TaxID=504468 RepID=A0A5M6J0F4_9PROT|nr:acyl-CoA dehydrogenase family protein [Rhodovastum atsumiense]KAA5614086.1 pimeloyl-CoA dehydrogenase small subunit [Rhodovastum atsumiense]CAH2598908.1 Pimeloyl-CoA dehydrogenase small subunit [Rhodovastum atsumiense]
MNFDLADEQVMLGDSVSRWLSRSYGFDARARILVSSEGWSRTAWQQMAELGLLGLPFAEADGGFGGGAEETMIVMEAFGRALVVEPYLSGVVLAGAVLRLGASAAQRQDLIPRIAEGSLVLALAHTEAQARWDLANLATRAMATAEGWRLSGHKSLVLHGEAADRLIVSARTDAGEEIGLFLVDPAAAGVLVEGYPTQDGQRAADITLQDVLVPATDMIGLPSQGLAVLEQATDEAIAAVAAEAVGAMAEALTLTVEYLKTRTQFGVAIGSFQALQHRAADMFIALEQARSMTFYAVMSLAEEDAGRRRRAIAAAKVQVAKSAKFIGQQAIQLHGGIGMTMECKVGHLFRRLTIIERQFGDTDYHLHRLAGEGSLLEDV